MRFTVLTATYNRAAHLANVYESLCAQTFRDFEWIIVDDGGADGTREMVAGWKPFFPVRYIWKPNGGKHTAINIGVRLAAGELIMIVDSDDRCLPQTLERLDYHWKKIPSPERFAFLTGLCYEQDGTTLLGKPFPRDCMDTFELRETLALPAGDRCGIVRADVIRNFPYPEFENERFILEGVVWNRILRRYGARYVNEPFKIAGYAPGGLSQSGDLRFASPRGAVVYHWELVMSAVPVRMRLKAAINALRFSFVVVGRKLRMVR